MDNDKILSLCASVITNQGKDMLFRIADVNEYNELVPFCFDPSLPHNAENTNLIYCNPRETQAEGTIAYWKWSVQDGYKQFSYINSGVSWIEYIRLNDITSVEELRIAFFDGIDIDFSSDHDYLIEYSSDNGKICQCVFCKSTDFMLLRDRYTLRDNIYRLDRYEISNDDIFGIRTSLLPKGNKYYYKYLALPVKSGSLLVRSPADTVKQAIQKRIQRCTEGFSKSDKKTIADFVKNLSTEDIVKHIADECRCTIEEASEYIDEFVKTCERYFAEDDLASSVLLHLIEYNSEIGMKYQEAVQGEWERQNAERIADAKAEEKRIADRIEMERQKADSEFSAAKNRLDDLLSECEEYEKLRADIETKLSELQNEYDGKLSIADGITKQVQDKIATAKSDISAFFAEYAMFAGEHSSISPQATYNSGKAVCKLITEDPETIMDANDLFEHLKENLEAVGVAKLHCSALSAYLLAAYFTRVPLIIAGYGADAIINAVSATLFNREAEKIFVAAGMPISEKADSNIVAVYNGFCSMGTVLNSMKSSYVYFVSQTSEELMLEPRSVYNYALPVFTEYFVVDNVSDELFGSISAVKYSGIDKTQKPHFPGYVVPPLAYSNSKKLLGISAELHNGITPYDIHLLSTLPIMLSLSKREELLELLSSTTLSDKDKEKIYEHMGEKQ